MLVKWDRIPVMVRLVIFKSELRYLKCFNSSLCNMAKPWAPSHIAEVAKGLGIDLRIGGDGKTALVPILETELRRKDAGILRLILLEDVSLYRSSNRLQSLL